MSTSRATTIQYQNSVGIIDVIENAPDLSGGDMYTNVYDPDKDGKVTSAETADLATDSLDAQKLSGYVLSELAQAKTVVGRDGGGRVRTATPVGTNDATNLSYIQANYTTTTNMNTALADKANSADVYTKSATDSLLGAKANSSHTHFASNITDLSTLLAAKAPLASPTFTGAVAMPALTAVTFDGAALSTILGGYVGAATTQTVYGTKTFAVNPLSSATQSTATNALTRKDYVDGQVATKANATHTHVIADTTGLQTALDGKASSSHTHTIANITNLQTTLDGKAASSHTHTIANVTGLQTALDAKSPTASPTFSGTVRLPEDTTVNVSGVNYHLVNNGTAQSIGGTKTFTVNPISTATQSTAVNALTRKDYVDGQVATKADATHTHTIANITNLQTTLDAKANDNEVVKISGNYTISGTKTFTGNINVPTPSTATQAANKAYVDSKAGTIYSVTDTTSGSTRQISFASIPEGKYEV